MLFNRVLVQSGGQLPTPSRAGHGLLGNLSVKEDTRDANHALSVDDIAGGGINYISFSAGRTVTTPSAAAMIAAAPDMDIGDSFTLVVSIQDAFAATWAAGAGVTLAGRATTPASSFSLVAVKRTGAATMEWRVL